MTNTESKVALGMGLVLLVVLPWVTAMIAGPKEGGALVLMVLVFLAPLGLILAVVAVFQLVKNADRSSRDADSTPRESASGEGQAAEADDRDERPMFADAGKDSIPIQILEAILIVVFFALSTWLCGL